MMQHKDMAIIEFAARVLTFCKSEKYDDAQKLQALIDMFKKQHEFNVEIIKELRAK